MTRPNILGGFSGSCIYPVDKEGALAKLKRHDKEIEEEENTITEFSNIMAVPQPPLPAIKAKPSKEGTSLILTHDDYRKSNKRKG